MRKLNSVNLSWPTDWGALFGREAPIILEIGFGRAAFLFHLARTFPDANVVGLEISNRCLDTAERGAERFGYDNLRVVHSTAESALHHLFAPETLSQIHVNFPDPWFKTKHRHRRLMQRDTLDAIVSRLRPGGLFYLATDIREYAEMSAALLAETPGMDNLLETDWANSLPGRVVTKYEATAQQEGRACYYFARRRNALVAPPVPVIKEVEMPHAVFTSPVSLDEVQARFKPFDVTDNGTIVNVLDCYRGRHTLLFEVYVKEPTIDQRVALLLKHRLNGDFTLVLGTLGHPRHTEGMQKAVTVLGNWLLSLHPDARRVAGKAQDEVWDSD
jgi:tRNA (guanine-N7-)-methyltransferase